MVYRKSEIEWGRVRDRLATLVMQRRGVAELRPADIAWLSSTSGVQRTTLGRFLELIPNSKTKSLQFKSIRKLCTSLDVPENWMLHGVGSEQRGIWPTGLSTPIETNDIAARSAVDVLLEAARSLVHISNTSVQTHIARGALLGMLEVAGTERVILPPACYAALVWLEEHRNVA